MDLLSGYGTLLSRAMHQAASDAQDKRALETIDQFNSQGFAAIHTVCMNNDYSASKLVKLLDRGADPNMKSRAGQ
jgi:hypothetical protein